LRPELSRLKGDANHHRGRDSVKENGAKSGYPAGEENGSASNKAPCQNELSAKAA
jgi:hypothetical protein